MEIFKFWPTWPAGQAIAQKNKNYLSTRNKIERYANGVWALYNGAILTLYLLHTNALLQNLFFFVTMCSCIKKLETYQIGPVKTCSTLVVATGNILYVFITVYISCT